MSSRRYGQSERRHSSQRYGGSEAVGVSGASSSGIGGVASGLSSSGSTVGGGSYKGHPVSSNLAGSVRRHHLSSPPSPPLECRGRPALPTARGGPLLHDKHKLRDQDFIGGSSGNTSSVGSGSGGTGSSTSGSGGGTSGDESKPFMTDKEKMRADLLAAESKLLKQKAKLTAMTESKMR